MNDIVLLEDSLSSISLLTDNEAGVLIKALIRHMKGIETENLPERVALIYPFVRGQVERMWALKEKNRANGSLGGRPKKNPNETQIKPNNNPTETQTKYSVLESETQTKAPIPKPIPIPNDIEKESKKKEKVDLPDTGIWADSQVREAFADYAKMRIRIKKSMTQEAVKRKIPQLERLASTASDAVDIIHRATDNCWLDFYADRQTAKPKEPGYIKRGTDYDSFLNQIGV